MEQNRLKNIILSIRRSKHNMINKIANFAQAIEDKGTVDMDTHELASIVKDAFTKRRKKEVYADLLSNIIGEPASSEESPELPPEQPAAEAPTFRSITSTNGVLTESTYTLGGPITCDLSNLQLPIDPYIIFLTDEEAQKFSVSIETNVVGERAAALNETFEVFDVPNEAAEISALKGNCTKMFYAYALGTLNDFGLEQNEYIRVIITYDGVDYVYST